MNMDFERLSKNLASGMSRRKALWKFAAGVGVLSLLTTKKAFSAQDSQFVCTEATELAYECLLSTGYAKGNAAACLAVAEEAYELCLEGGFIVESEGDGVYCSVEVEDNEITYIFEDAK